MLVAGKRFSYYKTLIRRQIPLYYFAYGSNMNWPQMQRRCPSAQFVCVARLANYEFGITRHSRLRNCGTANVFPAEGQEVCGIVYEVTDADLVTLDTFEDGYRRELMPVYVLGDGAQPLVVLIYVAEIETNVPRSNTEYKRLILEGARHWNLPANDLALLEVIQAAEIDSIKFFHTVGTSAVAVLVMDKQSTLR